MSSQLVSAKIKGIRSYSPQDSQTQLIDFMPLTLIVGKNGTGKTSIIEALKFIIAGEEPPNSDSRRNFINTSKTTRAVSNDHSFASIEIEFKNFKGESCVARREISPAGLNGKNATPMISSGYKINRGSWVNVNRQEEWSKILPRLFGLPNQAILSHVILCHQQDNLWCMGASAEVKGVFDKIFGCEQYKKEIKHIDDELKNCKREIELAQKDMQHTREAVKRKSQIKGDIERCRQEAKQNESQTKSLENEIEELTGYKKTLSDKLSDAEDSSKKISSLKQRIRELEGRETVLRRSLQPLLNRAKSIPERRPLPPPTPVKSRPKKKSKPEQDPVAVELASVVGRLDDARDIVSKISSSPETHELKNVLQEIRDKLNKIQTRFAIRIDDDEDTEDEEPAEDIHRKWYEEQEAIAAAAEARRQEEDRKMRESIELDIKENSYELDKAKEELNALNKQSGQILSNYEQKKQELREIEQKLMRLREKKSMISGATMQQEREIYKLEAEAKSYFNAHINYSESIGRLVCNRIIQDDLEKLKSCFNESISTFHDQMIVKINEALKSRWRQIYQGDDIDTIEVVVEEITRAKTKAIHYHMGMRKNGVTMRMREKSSAGQRALASIILRMTLAELFIRDLTFIALDEPTANLDITNVQALARSIGSYVRRRTKKGANIQWIIITHDEQFLRALDEESSPFFYRIALKDGYSVISKVSSHQEKNALNGFHVKDDGDSQIKF